MNTPKQKLPLKVLQNKVICGTILYMSNLVTIGRSEFIDFPEFGLFSVPAKTDSGAYRSAIHADNIEVINKDGHEVLAFDVLLGHPSAGQSAHYEVEDFREIEVFSSFGHKEKRYEIKVLCVLAGKRFRTSFSLANRAAKRYPVLMGRRLSNRRFIIDTSKSTIDRRLLKQKFNVELPVDEEIEFKGQ